ncbi:YopX family protein [Campylobacter sp. CNRCH_2014_2452]|uniref:YopX family protein n=1 Tax=Campylobacter sp. CNRCH_2014_2452 TaxID=2911603 RepID=UPI0017C43E2A|nr:YopX family protein [Campylobacter sp. CNRCH_2014_2452]EAJ6150334.1 hypothetical protein [Campylobacter lari]MCV3486126.1 YopX family protein [Campylobacter sp. CNRCH_2014_2452]
MKLKDFDFRIWDNNLKAYIIKNRTISKYSDSIDREDSLAGFIRRETHYGDLVFDNWSCDCEIELWTGLYDKNGKKIFEGDILEFFATGEIIAGRVVYDKEEARFELITSNKDVLDFTFYSDVEIIGNIHENHI